MATLTSAGVNCSDGTLNGQYSGTSSSYTTYPIGQYVLAGPVGGCCPVILSNATAAPGTSSGYINLYNPRTLLAGTWRTRGAALTVTLCQRVA
jgi:hypothetical protein